jgi:hypothetical protein
MRNEPEVKPFTTVEKIYVLTAPLIVMVLAMWLIQTWLVQPEPAFDAYASRDIPQTVPN